MGPSQLSTERKESCVSFDAADCPCRTLEVVQPIYLPAHRLDPYQLAKWSFRGFVPGFIIIFGSLGFALGNLFEVRLGWPLGSSLLFAAAFAGLMLPVMRLRLRGMYLLPKRAQFRVTRTMVLDEDMFKIDYENGVSSTIPWSIVTRTQWTPDFLILHTTLGNPMALQRSILTPDAVSLIERVTTKPNAARPRLDGF